MIKNEIIERLTTEVIVKEVICNFCGDPIKQGYREDDLSSFEPECVTIDHTWGYWSQKDMIKHRVDICEVCWDKLCVQMKIPPTVVDLQDPCPGYAEEQAAFEAEPRYEDDEYAICKHCKCCAGAHNSYISGGGCGCGNCSSSFEDVADSA